MKYCLSISLLVPFVWAWNVCIYDTACGQYLSRYYNVTADGDFDIVPWKGPAWEGYVEKCHYYFDGGLQGPFDCTGPNPGFDAKSVIIQKGNGHCASMSHSSEGTKGYRELWDESDGDSACYNWYDWEGIRCWD